MSEFWIYFNTGLRHVLDIHAYDHVLFLIALTIPYAFKDWQRVLLLVTLFTVGHTMALLLSVYGFVQIKVNLVEFLIPITILITAFFHLFTAGKNNKKESISFIAIVTLFFGIIHGLGFSNYFNTILPGNASAKLIPLLEFALGIEAAQVIVVLIVLILSYIVQTVFRFSKRDWTLVMSSFVIGVVIPMVIESEIWGR
ncbi:putative neutral ceramidase superfamily lipid hydrolase [Flavobacterium gossypii]|uniref:Neutral ceramidase superfamily lipid hydrolase n=1 Tax=Flavobacterium gossypii TaxID=1646119 RepID=A0ABR6DNN8_9FLAO|nr:HupE/UreJ family protein [Flavobacterium gossypii]MBA9073069.1 putative neutral ceramidase superfamily lipid hydrolase [Flavobacterium gossypii]